MEPTPPAVVVNPPPADLAAHRARRRRQLWDLLGDLPPRDGPRGSQLIAREKHPGFTLEQLVAGA